MKIKNILSIILINILLLCMVSIVQEYLGLQETFQRLDMIFDTAVDTSVSAVTASEEMFSDDFASAVSSRANSMDKSRYVYASTKVFRGNSWITGNLYIMAMYYNNYGTFPSSQTDYNMYANNIDAEKIYEYMFGNAGSEYNNAVLSWANNNTSISVTSSTSRAVTNSDFLTFYNTVGRFVTKDMQVKAKNGTSWQFATESVPILTMMGLRLNSYNEVTSERTLDNFTSSYHVGPNNTMYYLTPYSLGVTYVPVDILKPTVLSHLEQLIRFNKCKGWSTSLTAPTSIYNEAYASATGCLETSVYDDGSGGASSYSKSHVYPSNTKTYISGITDILNDGRIEYDMSTLKVKVDYFLVDFYNNANWKIVNQIEGSTPYSSDLGTLPSRLASTSTDTVSDGQRLVAKVTVKMKIHIPYQSKPIQWFIQKTSTQANEHFDIPLWDNSSHNIISNSDGVWYQYTTYTAITR